MRAIAVIGLLAIAASVPSESSAKDARPIVKVYVLRNVGDRNLNVSWAEAIATQIFAQAGVQLKWRLGEAW